MMSELDIGGNGSSTPSMEALESRLAQEIQEIADVIHQVPSEVPLGRFLKRVVQRRPYIRALAVISPGGRLWASALPRDVEAESVAAMAAPVALLGRRVALEQLGSDMRQTYVEGEGGYAILRAIGDAAVVLVLASIEANLALVLHDVDLLEGHMAQMMGISGPETGEWIEAAPSIERLRQMVGEDREPGDVMAHRNALRAKLDSLDLGLFPERIKAIRAKLQSLAHLEEVEFDLLRLEQDVMAALEQDMALSIVDPEAGQPVGQQSSFIRRALQWLASMIESED